MWKLSQLFKRKKKSTEPEALLLVKERAKIEVPDKTGALSEPSPRTIPKAPAGARVLGVLLKPLVSEKAAHHSGGNIYTFVVSKSANKLTIARAFWSKYKVKPLSIRVALMPEKRKRYGRTLGVRPGWKKAFIRVPAGSKVDVFTGV